MYIVDLKSRVLTVRMYYFIITFPAAEGICLLFYVSKANGLDKYGNKEIKNCE